MNYLEQTGANYKLLSTEGLISLAQTPEQLDHASIIILQNELINREKHEEARLLTDYLANTPEVRNFSTPQDLQAHVNERLAMGESIESIKENLKENGVDIFQVLNNQGLQKKQVFEYIMSLKDDQAHDIEITQRLCVKFGINEEEAGILQNELKSKGRTNLVLGIILVITMGIFVTTAIAAGVSAGAGGFLLIGIGIRCIILGNKQKR